MNKENKVFFPLRITSGRSSDFLNSFPKWTRHLRNLASRTSESGVDDGVDEDQCSY